jgi:cytochrome c biogenesis protein CcdA
MIAAVMNSGGRFTGAHLTFLRGDGCGKADVTPSRKMVGAVGGGHVPLIQGARLVVAEGIESALSAWETAVKIEGIPSHTLGAVAALSAGGVSALAWPPGASSLLIAPDRDASGAGELAASTLASRAYAAGLRVAFLRPPAGLSDWNAWAIRAAGR